MYDTRSNLILGFHGCEKSIRDGLLTNPDDIKMSEEKYDWLGHGMYFWENNFERALQFANDKKDRGKIKEPAVIGAILQLGYCCDFLDSRFTGFIKLYYKLMEKTYEQSGSSMPANKDVPADKHNDQLLRVLDCTVIEFMHTEIEKQQTIDITSKGFSDVKIFDSVRGLFREGGPVFEGAGIFEKSHIQICIRNPNCIKGFFLPRNEIEFP